MVGWLAIARLVALFFALGVAASARAEDSGSVGVSIAVVANDSVSIDNLKLDQLREILLGRRRFWADGGRIELVVEAEDGPAREMFVKGVSGLSELRFRQYWINQIFAGRANSAPRAAPGRRMALALIAAIPGAIGLVQEGEIPPGVRVLRINDQALSDAGYPLRAHER